MKIIQSNFGTIKVIDPVVPDSRTKARGIYGKYAAQIASGGRVKYQGAGRVEPGRTGFWVGGISRIYKGIRGLQHGAIHKKLYKENLAKGMEKFKAYDKAMDEALDVVKQKKLKIVHDRMGKIDYANDEFVDLIDEHIRLSDSEGWRDYKKLPETIKNKHRAEIFPEWAETNWGEDYSLKMERTRAREISESIDPNIKEPAHPSFVGEQQTLTEIDEMNKANLDELLEGRKKNVEGGRIGYDQGGQLVDHGPAGVRQGYQGNPLFGTEITGTIHKGKIFGKNQEKLNKLIEIITESNGSYTKTITSNDALVKAGWKGGWQDIATEGSLRKAIKKQTAKINTTFQKMDNYVNNVMLAEDALVQDFRNPQKHLAKKFGVSRGTVNSWANGNPQGTWKGSKVWAENKTLFKGLGKDLSFNKFKLLPDGTPRLMSDYSTIVQNKLPSTDVVYGVNEEIKFIQQSAKRNYLQMKAAGLDPKVTFITDPTITPQNQWQFIDNETGRLFSTDASIDTVEYQGKSYKNNYLNRADARKLYKKEFGNVYRMFDEDLVQYLGAEVIGKDGKPIKLDEALQQQAFEKSKTVKTPKGKKDFFRRRFMDIDHVGESLWEDPFGRKDKNNLRLMDRTTNTRAGIIKRLEKYRNNPKLLASKLDEIGYNRKFTNTDELIKFYSGTVGAVPKVKIPPGGPTLGSTLANVDADMFDFRKLPGDIRHFADIAARYGAKSPALMNVLKKATGAGKWLGWALAAEPAFAAPFAEYEYKMGESPERMLGTATWGLFGETEEEELRKAVGERGYATQQIENYGSTLSALEENYRTLNDQNDPRGEKRQRILNLYNNTRGKYNTAYGMFVDDQGQFDKSMYNQALNNYTAGIVQIDKFKKQKQAERIEQAGGYDNILQEREIRDIKGYAGGGLANLTRTVAPDSGPMHGGLAGLRPGFKYGGTWKDWILNHEDQMTFEEYLKMDIEKDDSE